MMLCESEETSNSKGGIRLVLDPSIEALNELSVSSVSDALDMWGIDGGLEGLQGKLKNVKMIGPAFTVQFQPVSENEPAEAANYIEQVPEGHVIVLSNRGRTDCTVWGDLLTTTAVQQHISGTVIDGCYRDADRIEALQFPVYAKGVYMKSGKNRVKMTGVQVALTIGNTVVRPGDIVFGDDSGVLVIPRDHLTEIGRIAREVEAAEKKIEADVRNGLPLNIARKRHRYDQYAWKPYPFHTR